MNRKRRLPDAVPALYPLPVVLVSSGDGQRSNIMTAAWVGIMSSEPPVLGVGIRPERHSHRLVTASGEFVINVPGTDMVDALAYCGRVSGRDADKLADLGLTAAPPGVLRHAPLVAECPVNMECRVRDVISLGSHDLFLGTIVAVWADQRCLTATGRIDPSRLNMVAYAGGRYFGPGGEIPAGQPPDG